MKTFLLTILALSTFIPAAMAEVAPDDASAQPNNQTVRKHHIKEDLNESEGTALQRPNALSLELLGRGLLYGLNYDRSVSDSLGLGVGFSYWGASIVGTLNENISGSVAIIPLYTNYYFSPGPHRGFISGGLDIVYVSANISDYGGIKGTGVLATAGGGYEYRGDGGFLFRAAPYILAGAGGIHLWGGLSLGGTF